MGEWPLIIFTVLSQLVTGALITLWILDRKERIQNAKKARFLVGSLFIIMGVGLLASLFHLGHPFQAYKALTHLNSSWLSREVALFAVLMGLMIGYFLSWSKDASKNRKTIGTITAIVALLGLLSSAMIYSLPARPAWNNLFPTFFFIMTGVLLGPLYTSLFLNLEEDSKIKLTSVIGIGALISAIGFALYVSALLGGVVESYQSGVNFLNSPSFWLRAALGWLLPMALILNAHLKKSMVGQTTFLALFIMIFVGEIIGRELFYHATIALKIASF